MSRREGVAILFVNPEGRVLLRLRDDEPGLAFPGQWDTIGGAVESSEAPLETAIRETSEEIGLELLEPIFWRTFESVVLLHIYAAPLDVPEAEIALTEGAGVGWFSLEAAQALPLHPWVAAVLPEFLASAVYRRCLEAFGSVGGETLKPPRERP